MTPTLPLERRIAELDFKVAPWITMKLETRIRNALQQVGIHTVGDLVGNTASEVKNIRGIGIVCLVAIETKLKAMGMKLSEQEHD